MRTLRSVLLLNCLFLLSFFPLQKKRIKVYLIGDSTMSVKQVKAYPETGWGMPFTAFFDSTVEVDNRAQNGRSTRSFMAENRWQPVVDKLQKGDYVFVQFGHNDEVPTKATYTKPEEFTANLVKYIADSKSKGAIPVLLTPVARRKFDAAGHITGTHDAYSALVRTVAQEQGVALIDLDQISQQLLEKMGPENSRLLFNWVEPGEHPNYPQGKQDDTHFNELGARKMAGLVLAQIKALHLELAERIVKP